MNTSTPSKYESYPLAVLWLMWGWSFFSSGDRWQTLSQIIERKSAAKRMEKKP